MTNKQTRRVTRTHVRRCFVQQVVLLTASPLLTLPDCRVCCTNTAVASQPYPQQTSRVSWRGRVCDSISPQPPRDRVHGAEDLRGHLVALFAASVPACSPHPTRDLTHKDIANSHPRNGGLRFRPPSPRPPSTRTSSTTVYAHKTSAAVLWPRPRRYGPYSHSSPWLSRMTSPYTPHGMK